MDVGRVKELPHLLRYIGAVFNVLRQISVEHIHSLIMAVDWLHVCFVKEGVIKWSELVRVLLLSELSSSLEVAFIVLSEPDLLSVLSLQGLSQEL